MRRSSRVSLRWPRPLIALASAALAVALALGACTASTERELGQTPQATTSLNLTTYNFGSLQVGDTSAAEQFQINEITANTTDTISAVSYSCPDFTVTATLPGYADRICETGCNETDLAVLGATVCPEPPLVCSADPYYFTATFHPTVAAAVSCVVSITTTSNTLSLTLSGTGTPPPIHVTASPGSVAFGGVRVMTASSPVTIAITNSGGSTATVSSVAAPTGFALSSGPAGSFSLGAGATQDYSLVCSPTAVGALSGDVTIASNDPNTPTISIPVSCSGIDSSIAVTPSPIALAATRVGEPIQQTITIANTGGAASTLQDVTLTGLTMITAPPAGTMLAASGGSTTATIGFDAAAAGSASGNLHIDYDSGKSLDVPVTAQALATSMSLTPNGDVDFGPVCAGQTSTQTFDVVANQQGPFMITAISTPDMPFALTAPTLPAAVQGDAGNTVAFMIAVSPTDAGAVSSSVEVTTDIPNGMPNAIDVTVTGLAAGVAATPPTVDVGPAELQMTTLAQPVQVSNCSVTPVTVTAAKVTGADAASFAIVTTPDSSTIAPYASATWLVVMTAQTAGTKTATFEADFDDGGSATAALTGEALIDGSDVATSVSDKSSYYACSASGGGGLALWPVAGALAALTLSRRRRRAAAR